MPGNGNATFTPQPLPPLRKQPTTAVLRCRDPEDPAAGTEHLTNVRWMEVERREGPHPSRAVLRYAFDGAADASLPRRIQAVLGVAAAGPGVVRTDDRLLIATVGATGRPKYLFDGFALAPEASLDRKRQGAAIHAVGVEAREWDRVLEVAAWRDAMDPTNPAAAANARLTSEPIVFNPGGKGNAAGADAAADVELTLPSGETRQYYPAFIDPAVPFDPAAYPDGEPRRKWTLGMCARYICGTGNPPDRSPTADGPTWVGMPLLQSLDGLLTARVPAEGRTTYDPDDPSTYEDVDVVVPERDVTGQAWPEALDALIRPYGFALYFDLGTDGDGVPTTELKVYKVADNANTALKDLYLQPEGEAPLDPARSVVAELRLARDASGVVNEYAIRLAPTEIEASFVLAPLFRIGSPDAAAKADFKSSNPDPTVDRDKYRLFGVDEAGIGHWSYADDAMVIGRAVPLADLFGTEEYAVRLRPGKSTLFSTDDAGHQYKARLAILVGYAGAVPGVWGGTGTAYPVHGGWSLEAGQLAIRVTAEDPNAWHVGPYDSVAALNGGSIRLVEWLDDPAKRVHLLLTTTIETDEAATAEAPDRKVGPTAFTVKRVVDGRAQYKRRLVDKSSPHYVQPSDKPIGDPVVARDDAAKAGDDARARREAHQYGDFGGPVTLRRLFAGYRVGDRIRSVVGRGLDMRQGVGGEGGEGAPYPRVVGVTWSVTPKGFETRLSLSDHRDVIQAGERGRRRR